jgi:hypothetical protein
MLTKCHSREDARSRFQAMVNTVASDTGAINGKVKYSRPCGPICYNAAMPVRVLEARLLRYYAGIVASAPCKPALIGLRRIFIQHVYVDKIMGTETITTVQMDVASGRSGPHLETQTFTLYNEVSMDALRLLEPDAEPYTQMLRDRAGDESLNASGHGPYTHVSERELISLVIDPIIALTEAELRVTDIEVLLYILDVEPARWKPSWSVPESHDRYIYRGRREPVTKFMLHALIDEEVHCEAMRYDDDVYVPEGLEALRDWLEDMPYGADESPEDAAVEAEDGEEEAESDGESGGGGDDTDVVEIPSEEDPVAEQLATLNLTKLADGYFDATTGQHCGTLDTIMVGEPHIRCVCALHDNCKCFMQTRTFFPQKWHACIKWMADGRGVCSDRHEALMVELKKSFGIQARPRARR